MLLDTENRSITTVGVQQLARATIKTSPKIFNFFADQTYANKPRAICRELVANAFDSHVMAGKAELPVEVWLPTIIEPTFRVRDHGLGMSHDFMMTQFMCYADGSTKDQSNVAIGGFGIGSKSPFAYVDQYTVVSRFDGVESVYSIFKDDEGIPAIGLLGQRATTEANGVEVAFPVKPDDFETFEAAAFEALRYFNPLPNIINASTGSFEAPKYISEGTVWAMRPDAGALGIIMGGIRYPVDANSLTYKFPADSAARKLLNYGLDLRLPIGSCSVALSREHLSYDDRTIEAIHLACETVVTEVAESFSTMFDHLDSAWEARVALHNEIGGGYGDRAKFLAEHAMWKGESFDVRADFPKLASYKREHDGQLVTYPGYTYWDVESSDARTRKGKTRQIGSAKWEHPARDTYCPGTIGYLVIDDLPPTPKHKAIKKIKEFAAENGERLLVIRPDDIDQVTADAVLAGFGNPPGYQVVLTSSLPEPIVERISYGKNQFRPRVRMFTYDGSEQDSPHHWGRTTGYSIRPEKRGINEIPYGEQPDTGILVVCEKFELPGGFMGSMKYGLFDWDELYFVNAGDAKKLKGWTRFETEFEARKRAALAEYPELAARLAISNCDSFYNLFQFFRRNPDLPELSMRTPLGKIRSIFRAYVEPLTEHQRKLAPLVTAKMPAKIKPDELIEQFTTKQWKAHRLIQVLSDVLDAEDTKILMENL